MGIALNLDFLCLKKFFIENWKFIFPLPEQYFLPLHNPVT